MTKKLLALKAVLLLRTFNRYSSKEEQIEDALKYYSEKQIEEWIISLKDMIASKDSDNANHYEDVESDECESENFYTPSCTNGDYSPSCPWNAPGMSIADFI